MGIDTLKERIENAYAKLSDATEVYHRAAWAFNELDVSLKANIVDAQADGRINGKNADMRAAQARELFAETHNLVVRFEEKMNQARHNLAVAQLEVDLVRALLRVAEVEAGRRYDADSH